MGIIEITDLGHKGIEAYVSLTEAQLRNRVEAEKGIFIAETATVISNALDAGYEPVSLLVDKRHIEGKAAPIIERCANIPVYTAESQVIEKITGYHLTRGVLCAMKRPKEKTAEEVCSSASRVCVLESIVDTSNVGAIFRSAAALGMDAVLLSPNCCDPLYRKAIRVSMGNVFKIPWARFDAGWPHPGMDELKAMGFKTAALALTDKAISIEEPYLAKEEKLALILGNEGDGLCSQTIKSSDYTVIIPMSAGVDSLNVAAAAAVAFWQVRKR
ncbi:MAG: RNA methyltransferase [Oscillospiraceae bacterium]|nr:RNA methyltransferase [Oscillospiraceae bacterium]